MMKLNFNFLLKITLGHFLSLVIANQSQCESASKLPLEKAKQIISTKKELISPSSSLPDLKPSTSNGASITIDESCNISVQIENWGPVDSPASSASLKWMDKNGIANKIPVDVPIVPKRTGAFQPGMVLSNVINSRFHSIAKNVQFIITADDNNIITESIEGNNTKTFAWDVNSIEGIPPQCVVRPDLIVTKVEWKVIQKTPTQKDCSLDVTVKNIGKTNLNGQGFYVSIEGIVDNFGQSNHIYSAPSLEVNQESTHNVKNFKAKNATTSTKAYADKSTTWPSGYITESNDQNNSLSTNNIPSECIAKQTNINCDLYGQMDNGTIESIDLESGQTKSVLNSSAVGYSDAGIAFFNNKLYSRNREDGKLYRINTANDTKILIDKMDGWGFGMGGSSEGLVMDIIAPGGITKYIVYNPESKYVVRSFGNPVYPEHSSAHDISTSANGKHKIITQYLYQIAGNGALYSFGIFDMDSNLGTFDYSNQIAYPAAPYALEEVMGTIYYTGDTYPSVLNSYPPISPTPIGPIKSYRDFAYGCPNEDSSGGT
ncbi:MAG: CARDB domain-containing protein [Bacteriovoracaceae bacterium]|nr:CARDB domain-containing protein [Bacteriovoracaceae bacterium]